MKRVFGIIGVLLSCLVLRAQEGNPGYHLEGKNSLPIPVSGVKMTNLVFPVGVVSAVKVSRDVLMQRPKGVENVVELKAVRGNFTPTNITVYMRDGRELSFVLHFVEDTSVLDYRVVRDASGGVGQAVLLSGWPASPVALDSDAAVLADRRPFLRSSVTVSGVRLQMRGIYLRDSLLWLCLGVRDLVRIGFTPVYLRVYVEDRKRVKRTASQQVEIAPVYASPLRQVAGGGFGAFAVGLTPFVPAKGKRLVVEMADAGGRVLLLRVKGKKVLKARMADNQ